MTEIRPETGQRWLMRDFKLSLTRRIHEIDEYVVVRICPSDYDYSFAVVRESDPDDVKEYAVEWPSDAAWFIAEMPSVRNA